MALDGLEESTCDVVVDLRDVGFVDSTALGALVGLTRRARERGGDLRLVVDNSHVLRVLRVTNLDSLISVLPELPADVQPHSVDAVP
jgi:anti-anti-sigma factor